MEEVTFSGTGGGLAERTIDSCHIINKPIIFLIRGPTICTLEIFVLVRIHSFIEEFCFIAFVMLNRFVFGIHLVYSLAQVGKKILHFFQKTAIY